MPSETEIARHRLWAMHADLSKDTGNLRGKVRWTSKDETDALRVVLEELHRMNKVVSQQEKTIRQQRSRLRRVRGERAKRK